MAHKTLEDGRTVVDWETGDPEGDRKYLMAAYRDFISEVKDCTSEDEIFDVFKKWNVSTDNQVDGFPRIWIKRPE